MEKEVLKKAKGKSAGGNLDKGSYRELASHGACPPEQ